MSDSTLGNLADFTVKIIIMFSTVLTLIYYAQNSNGLVFSVLAVVFLIAIIIKGITNIFKKKEEQ